MLKQLSKTYCIFDKYFKKYYKFKSEIPFLPDSFNIKNADIIKLFNKSVSNIQTYRYSSVDSVKSRNYASERNYACLNFKME